MGRIGNSRGGVQEFVFKQALSLAASLVVLRPHQAGAPLLPDKGSPHTRAWGGRDYKWFTQTRASWIPSMGETWAGGLVAWITSQL